MLAKQIRSLQHPLVKELVKLRKDKSYRYMKKKVFLSGKKIIQEVASLFPISLLILKEKKDQGKIKAKEIITVTDEILKKISGVKNPEPFAAVMELPEYNSIDTSGCILILDNIADPGNLGTLFRTALALGFSGIILTPNTVDPFNDKAIRASKGACFSLPFLIQTKEEILTTLKKSSIYLADMDGKDIEKVTFEKPCALILSNESLGAGIWPAPIDIISVKMKKNVESLNVAVCGSIIMYKMAHGK
ncbi:MAG: RNA methyltransferase [Chlamydiota bacterium]|jgi:TrmH family RNA methyltransferase